MRAAYLMAIITILSFTSGCLTVPISDICEDENCFDFSVESFSNLLSQENAFDIISYSQLYPQLRVEAYLVSEQQSQRGEIYWNVAKDEESGLSSISSRLVLGESIIIDNEYIEGNETNNYRVGNEWYEGRDQITGYSNPFIKLSKSAAENPDGFWPPFSFNTNDISDLDWTISVDLTSNQLVATAINQTHSIYVETRGMPPVIVAIETYSDTDNFILKVSTENVSISINNGLIRAPAPFILNPDSIMNDDNITYWSGIISDTLSIDINPDELEIHGLSIQGSNATSIISMRLDLKATNLTMGDGTWWEFNWIDYLGENLVSNGDLYTVRTNSTGNLSIAIYDLWADAWTDMVF
ncbi:MAG: hypothetical protein ACI9O1_001260 [Candidatus Thalassarchaeaceae archaeon]|jgi:hypothetical protein